MPAHTTETLPRLVLTSESGSLSRLLHQGQRLLVHYPQAARALISAFVEEGRRFSETMEGRAWKEKLAEAEVVRRGRFIWDAYSLDALLDPGEGPLPSAWLDVILAAVTNPDLETILSNLLVEEVQDGTFDLT